MIICFCVLLTLTSLIPKRYLTTNIKESATILKKETNYLKIYLINKHDNIVFDNYTDALMLNTAYSISPTSPFYSWMVARKNYIEGKTKIVYNDVKGPLKSDSKYEEYDTVGELNDIANDEIDESFEYARYWHGYLIFLRPLLVLLNITQIRMLLIVMFAILGAVFLFLLYKKFNLITALVFLFGLIICDYFYIGLSLQGSFIFLITIIASIIILTKNVKNKNMLFFIIGGLTSFFDFLTVPIITLGIPILLYSLLFSQNDENYKKIYINLFKLCIFWGIAYIGVWFTKWIFVDILYNKGLIKTVIEQFKFRTVNSGDNKVALLDIFIYCMSIIYIPGVFFGILTFLLVIIKLIKIGKLEKTKIDWKKTILLLVFSQIGIIPYIVLKQHSLQHMFFVYRNIWVTYTGILLAIIYSIKKIDN